MGYYISVLKQGQLYELDGIRLEFAQKTRGLYYFYIYKFDSSTFAYNRTDLLVSYKSKELNYLKRVQECSPKGVLKRIGRDKVFARN